MAIVADDLRDWKFGPIVDADSHIDPPHAMWRDYVDEVPPADLCIEGFLDAFWRSARAPAASPAPATTPARSN